MTPPTPKRGDLVRHFSGQLMLIVSISPIETITNPNCLLEIICIGDNSTWRGSPLAFLREFQKVQKVA